jgi:hypothetical protein
MNHNEHPSDGALTQQLRDSLAELATRERPPLAAITTRGRTHQRQRLAGFASLGAACIAAGTALALGLTGVFGAAQALSTSTIRTTAFTLVKHTNGTATLTINASVLLEPGTLQSDLQQDGIPAIVTTGSFCSSDPSPAGFNQVTETRRPPPGTPPTFTINPAAMPAGTELSFGFFQLASVQGTGHPGQETVLALIDTNSYTCASSPPANGYATVVYIPGGGPK